MTPSPAVRRGKRGKRRKTFSLGAFALDALADVGRRSCARDESDAVTRALVFYANVLGERAKGTRLLYETKGAVREAVLIEPMGDAA